MRGDRRAIQTTIEFLAWLDSRHTMIGKITQEHLDQWLVDRPTRHSQISPLIC